MDSKSALIKADIFVNEIRSVKICTQKPCSTSRPPLKVEMQSLRLSESSEKMVMDTLESIHGVDFKLKDASEYKNQKSNLERKYWLERGTLIVKGGCDNSQKESEEIDYKFKIFAEGRLLSYGFHKSHCVEALVHCNGEVDKALELLFMKYYNVEKQNISEFTKEEILEQRIDEKNVLESIYDSNFVEKIHNHVWVLTFNLPYFLKFLTNKSTETKTVVKEKKVMCRNFIRGIPCKYLPKCRFSHEEEKIVKSELDHLLPKEFTLEIRFPEDSKYPYEAPFLYFKCSTLLPDQISLRLCKRLYQEAQELAKQGMVSIYSIAELLQNEEEILQYLKNNKDKFIPENESLFKNNTVPVITKPLPSHYKKGLTNRDNKLNLTPEEIRKEDHYLAKNFKNKLENAYYLKFLTKRKSLPAWSMKQQILNVIQSHPVTVISGETGCGKSTQVPQFLLDDWLSNYSGDHIEIVCTQPRRISAIGVAERVAQERAEKIGRSIGYQIRLESKVSASTRVTFCTTGILLRRLECESLLPSVTHIIVDEVHERSEDSDFLLLCLKQILTQRPNLKIILMSATLDAHTFSEYFGEAPIISIPGRTFSVEQFFLEDVLEMTNYIVEENTLYTINIKNSEKLLEELETCDVLYSSSITPKNLKDEECTIPQLCFRYKEYSKQTAKNIYLMDPEKVNLDLIEHLLIWLVNSTHDFPKEGSILVFLPGIAEIKNLMEQLAETTEFNSRQQDFIVLPLHSSLSAEEQALVFQQFSNGSRKIILATNIAETSVTIDDCVYVIDAARVKERRWDAARCIESLQMVWASRANLQQRKGRAGRVRPGYCFHLITKNRFEEQIPAQPIPELLRIPLDRLLLRIKILPNFSGEAVYSVLQRCIEPPTKENVSLSIERLQDIGALDFEEQLTSLGLHLAALPVDVRIGKLVLLGTIFCCVDAALTMAACLSYRSPFQTSFAQKFVSDSKKKTFSVANSDQLTVLKAYNKWREAATRSRKASYAFAHEHFLSVKTLETLVELKYQLLELLVNIGFVPVDIPANGRSQQVDNIPQLTGAQLNQYGDNQRLLAALLCSALYPNVAKILTPGKTFSHSSFGAVPRNLNPDELRFCTRDDGYVALHPSSINTNVSYFPSPYIVFQEKLRTSRLFIKDCTMVPVLPLVLFSGLSLDIQVHNGTTILSLADGWIMFQVEKHIIAEMLKLLRSDLSEILEEKIRDPCLNLLHHEKGKRIISTIVHIITVD